MSQALPTQSSNNYSDDFRTEAQLTWVVLLLASFALGAVFIWSLSNQQLLMPSAVTPGAPIVKLSPLPKRLEVAGADINHVGKNVIDKVNAHPNSEASVVDAAALETIVLRVAAAESAAVEATVELAVVEAALEIATAEAVAAEVASTEKATEEVASVEAAEAEAVAELAADIAAEIAADVAVAETVVAEAAVELAAAELAAAELAAAELAAAELAAAELAAAELAAAELAAAELAAAELAAVELAAVELAEAAKIQSTSSLVATENSIVVETEPEISPVNDASVEVADVNDTTVNDSTIEVGPIEAVPAELDQIDIAKAEIIQARDAVVEAPVLDGSATDDFRKRIELQEIPVLEPGGELPEIKLPVTLAQESWLFAELTTAEELPVVSQPVTPLETAFEKLRREELALLATYSEKLQVAPDLDVLEDTATPQLFQIFDLLFLYSETPVSVRVQSNDTDSTLRNLTLSQQRGDLIVDYLVLSGLDRSRFDIVAESPAELPLGGHRIAIQATLD